MEFIPYIDDSSTYGNVWNKLPADADFSSLITFKHSIDSIDFSDYIQCF